MSREEDEISGVHAIIQVGIQHCQESSGKLENYRRSRLRLWSAEAYGLSFAFGASAWRCDLLQNLFKRTDWRHLAGRMIRM